MTTPNSKYSFARRRGEQGFSLIELLAVMVVGGVLTTLAVMTLSRTKALYATDDQTLQIMEMIREANLKSLTNRRTFRVEIDFTDNKAELIDENGAGASDDRMIRWLPLPGVTGVQMSGTLPLGINTTGLPTGYTASLTGIDTTGHIRGGTFITSHNVWSLRFRSDGALVDRAGNLASATLYFWLPKSSSALTTPDNKNLVRALTLFGPSGGFKFWRYNGTQFNAG